MALAWQQAQGGKCKGCGGWLDDTTHPDNEDAYTAHLFTCHRCYTTQRAVKDFSAGEQSPGSEGVYGYSTLDEGVTAS